MTESDLRNGTGVDAQGKKITTVAVLRKGKVVTSTVLSTGNIEQDEEMARRAAGGAGPQDSDHLKDILNGRP